METGHGKLKKKYFKNNKKNKKQKIKIHIQTNLGIKYMRSSKIHNTTRNPEADKQQVVCFLLQMKTNCDIMSS